MNKKLQVFISSTYIDLIDERQAAVQAVLDAGHISAGMELFKAGNRTQLETIYKWIDDSDVYMLILGGRYGSIEEESGKSYTHLEYEYAISRGLPIFAVILSDSFLKDKATILDANKIYEEASIQKYNDFKAMVMSKIVRTVNDSKDIMLAIHTTLKDFIEEYELIGWVRGDNTEANTNLLLQINQLNVENKSLTSKLSKLNKEIASMRQSFDDSLAFEGEEIEITGTYQERRGNRPGAYTTIKHSLSKKTTWDNMFLLWAPRLVSTLNVQSAKHQLEYALKDIMGRDFSMGDNLFNKIKVQFYALGLIKMYQGTTINGAVSEAIELSEKGKNYLVRNSAVKKHNS